MLFCLGKRGFAVVALAVAVCVGGCAAFQVARLYRRGSTALERGEIERAATLVPHASEIQNHLGLAYAASGRDGDALRAFRRAVELDCDNRQALHNLAVAERGAEP
jgi:Flp pilus assembly protein TadD